MTTEGKAVTREAEVSLREITAETVRAICRLAVNGAQTKFVAPNAVSIAQAYFEPKAWFRAVYAGDEPVGFAMIEDDREKPEYFLWRFMIDARYQRMGFGRRAMEQVIAHVKTLPNATELLTSCVQGDGGPQPFYEGLGFAATGEFDEGEAILKLKL